MLIVALVMHTMKCPSFRRCARYVAPRLSLKLHNEADYPHYEEHETVSSKILGDQPIGQDDCDGNDAQSEESEQEKDIRWKPPNIHVKSGQEDGNVADPLELHEEADKSHGGKEHEEASVAAKKARWCLGWLM
jgi:hypothetical protein